MLLQVHPKNLRVNTAIGKHNANLYDVPGFPHKSTEIGWFCMVKPLLSA